MFNRSAGSTSAMMLPRQSQSQVGGQRTGGDEDAAVGAQLAALFGGARTGGGSRLGLGGPSTSSSSSSQSASARAAPSSTGMGNFSSVASRQTASGSRPSTSRVIAPQSPTRHGQPDPVLLEHMRWQALVQDNQPTRQLAAASRLTREDRQSPSSSPSQIRTRSLSPSPIGSDPPSSSRVRPYVPRPRQPIGFLLEQQARQEREAHARSLAEQGSSLKRDERLRLMEELNLKVGPWEFEGTRAKFAKLEAYSGHSLKSRVTTHEDFQDIMDGRYYLSPSLLYSIRQKAVARRKGQDGDYDIPVEGEWLTIACVTGIAREWTTGKKKDQDVRRAWYEDGDGFLDPDEEAIQRSNRNREDKEDDGTKYIKDGRLYFLTDIGAQAWGPAGSEGGVEGHHELKLLTYKARGQDKDTGRYYGGTKGTYEKLGKYCHGQVIAIISPRVLAPKSKDSDDRMCLYVEGESSIVVLGNCKNYASCTARTNEGEKCGNYVDRRGLSGSRSREPICDYHLGIGVERTQRGRQEFANSSSSIGVKSSGRGSGGSRGKSRKSRSFTSGKRKGKGGKYEDRPWIPREALSFEGLNGRKGAVLVPNAEGVRDKDDIESTQFSAADHYGQVRSEKESRRKKLEEEAATLRRLEAKRAGWDGQERLLEIADRRQAEEDELSQLRQTQQQRFRSKEDQMEGDMLPPDVELPSNSIGALAIAEAQRTLADRREKKRKRDEEERLNKDKAAKRKQAVRNPGSNDRLLVFGSDSSGDENSERESASPDKRDRRTSAGALPAAGTVARPSVTTSVPLARTSSRYTAEEIQRIGFDPLSDPRARENRKRRIEEGGEDSLRGSTLLNRHKAPPGSLATPTLKLKKSVLTPNVRPPLPTAMSFAKPNMAGANVVKASSSGPISGGARVGGVGAVPAGYVDLSDGDSGSDLEII